MNGSMAGIFVILLGIYLAMVGFRGTHTAVFTSKKHGGLFSNTTPANAEILAPSTGGQGTTGVF